MASTRSRQVQRILLKDTVTHAVRWEYSQDETVYIPQQDTNKTLTCDDVTIGKSSTNTQHSPLLNL